MCLIHQQNHIIESPRHDEEIRAKRRAQPSQPVDDNQAAGKEQQTRKVIIICYNIIILYAFQPRSNRYVFIYIDQLWCNTFSLFLIRIMIS